MKDGYYWMRKTPSSEWGVVEVDEDFAFIPGVDVPYLLSDFFEIDPRPIERQPQGA